jgi:hypothetical protein
MMGVGAVENCLQFSKSLVGAFCASTGTAASTPSCHGSNVFDSVELLNVSLSFGELERGSTWRSSEVPIVVPWAS